jgi:hypothetical protein
VEAGAARSSVPEGPEFDRSAPSAAMTGELVKQSIPSAIASVFMLSPLCFVIFFYSCVSHGLTDFDLYVKCAGRQGRGGEILPVRDS